MLLSKILRFWKILYFQIVWLYFRRILLDFWLDMFLRIVWGL